jgi:hypothetical protein
MLLKGFPTSGVFLLKSDMSVYTSVLHRSVAKISSFEGPEEDCVADDSPIRDCIRS